MKQRKDSGSAKSSHKAKHLRKESACTSERLIIYQLFPRIFTNMTPDPIPFGSLKRNGSGHLSELSGNLLDSLKELGINCLWLTGVIEHATKTDFSKYGIDPDNPNVVKGEAGSPYAIKDYYDIDPSLADNIPERIREFEECVRKAHEKGMKIMIDFVPNHTARKYHSDIAPEGIEDFGAKDNKSMFFSPSNNYYYITNQQFFPNFNIAEEGTEPYIEFPAKATGNDCFTAFCSVNDWYETVKLNYGHDPGDNSDHFLPIPDTWLKMLDVLKYWASKGIDGFRCDMVFMVPLPFWHWVIPQIKKDYPSIIFIGEIYDIGLYRPFLEYGCFDYLYDKVNLYDTLVGIEKWNYSAARITDCWQAVDGIGSRMLNFLENHDEVRFASSEFGGDPRKVIPYLSVSALLNSGPFMIYYGQELGENGEDNEGFAGNNHRTTIFDYWSYDRMRRWYDNGKCTTEKLNAQEKWLRKAYSKILNLCNDVDAFRCGKFFDLMYVNLDNTEYNPHKIFSFLRYCEKEAYIVIANFSDNDEKGGIVIPGVAIEMAGLKEGAVEAEDLLWNSLHSVEISREKPLRFNIKARDALILPLPKVIINNKSN